MVIRGLHPDAFHEGIAQGHRTTVLPEKIAERLVGKILQLLAGVEGQLVQRVPSLGVERDAAPDRWITHEPDIPRYCGENRHARCARNPWNAAATLRVVRLA